MHTQTIATQTLDQTAKPPHTNFTCGQSRRGGLETSKRTRLPRFLGRVAVAYVQGSPKGGGALCVRRVSNTRLWLVPPISKEAIVRQTTKFLSIAITTASIVVAPAAAQTQAQIERRYTPDYNRCIDASGGVTSEMMDCTGPEIERQDARLNQAYVMVMRPLPRAGKDKLRGLQRAWIKRRDAKCAREVAGEDGSMAGLTYAGCILDETIRRTIFLENYKG